MNLNRFGFKAKKVNSKKWLYAGFDDSEELLRWLLRDENGSKYDPAWIDSKTLCQCTGLKDSDGKLIYENDYVSIGVQGKDKPYCIVNYKDLCLFDVFLPDGATFSLGTLQWLMEKDKNFIVKVVGNVFDRKEGEEDATIGEETNKD